MTLWVDQGTGPALPPIVDVDRPADQSRILTGVHFSWFLRTAFVKKGVGGFDISAPNPTPSSDYIPLGRRCAFDRHDER
jgi:hypothetical protein